MFLSTLINHNNIRSKKHYIQYFFLNYFIKVEYPDYGKVVGGMVGIYIFHSDST